MGEHDAISSSILRNVLGHEPQDGWTDDGRQCLFIGRWVVVATSLALWGSPRAWVHEDGALTVDWGGQTIRFTQNLQGEWQMHPRPPALAGKARWTA